MKAAEFGNFANFYKEVIDLDKYVDLKSISRCGRKFNPENLMPRSEITKLRPAIYHEHQKMIREYEKLVRSQNNANLIQKK